MASLIEQTRQLHADIERCERGVVDALRERESLKRHKDLLWNEHRMNHLCREAGAHASKLQRIYEDADGARRAELVALSGGNRPEVQFKAFNEKLREVQGYYRKFPPTAPLQPAGQEGGEDESYELPPEPVWSGEEFWGRYLDLHVHHERWLNLPGNTPTDGSSPLTYADYTDTFGDFEAVPIAKKTAWGSKYQAYVKLLRVYLEEFASKAKPLLQCTDPWLPARADFEDAWTAGTVPGWGKPQPAPTAADDDAGSDGIDLEQFESATALADAAGPEALKAELSRLGLKCGGNVTQRAERLFLTKGKPMSAWPSSIFAGAKKAKRKRGAGNGSDGGEAAAAGSDSGSETLKEACWEEVRIKAVLEVLEDVVAATRIQIEKKQTRTMEELEAELEADIPQDQNSDDDDDEEKAIYNPKNLPLGWDGKPIPYWLYKLHGLNIEYNCEICGNYKYVGPRAYDRHFYEWRHTHGLKCLGIAPDLFKFFHGVVLIEDALSLFKEVKGKVNKNEFQTEREEEFEDDDGNVYMKKTFEDLAKQGLIKASKAGHIGQ